MTPKETRTRLGQIALVPVVRAPSCNQALTVARELIDAGLEALEITFTVPDAADVISELANSSDVLVGAGTITEARQLTAAVTSGATFAVSPVNPDFFLATANEAGVLAIPGCATPNEIWKATSAGALAVKIFPAARLGGPAFLRDLAGPLAGLHIMPSGGISIDDISAYRQAGAWCIGLGSPLSDHMSSGERQSEAIRALRETQRLI